MHAPTKPFRAYSADEMLQIIDVLVANHELSDTDALGMTRLVLILKRFESMPYDDITAVARQSYREIRSMEASLPAKRAKDMPS